MKATTTDRKMDHVDIVINSPSVDREKKYFDAIRLKHRALPEVNLDDVDPSITFMGKRLSFPLLISPMTGGSDELLRTINRNLALAAEATGVALGVGSQRVIFSEGGSRRSFQLRDFAPTALLMANLGAVQLNYGFSVTQCKEAVEVLGADALTLHLNPLQEAIQYGGNTNYAGLLNKIGKVVADMEQPVVVKEVGSGLSLEDVRLLSGRGVRYVDVAGTGGTSWSSIEAHRSSQREGIARLGSLFQDWGIPTPQALQSLHEMRGEVTIIASGGIRTGCDMAKAVILGASLCGMATPFLKPAMKSALKVIELINQLKKEFVLTMFLLGVADVASLIDRQDLILPGQAQLGGNV